MSDIPINKMDFKQLRNMVQELADSLAIMKRKYEDAIYNLDSNNFSRSFALENDKMRTQVEVTAGKIETLVSELDEQQESISSFEQTANEIEASVKAIEEDYVTSATLEMTKNGITSTVEANKTDAEDKIEKLYSKIEQTEDGILSKVSYDELDNKLQNYTTINQTAESINALVTKGASLDEAEVKESLEDIEASDEYDKIYVLRTTDDNDNLLSEEYYYYNELSESWEIISGDSIYTVFTQTANGFELKGNVVINGNLFKTVDKYNNEIKIEKGLITLTPSEENSPKMKIGTYTDVNGTKCPYIRLGTGTSTENDVGVLELYKAAITAGVRFTGSDARIHGIWFYDVSDATQQSHIGFGNSILDFSNTTVKGLSATFG